MTDRFGLRADQRDVVDAILQEHAPVPSRIWAFGSRARGIGRRYSDLDLAIDAGRPLTFSDSAHLSDAFEESTLPWRVDIVDLASCSATFRREVESHAVLLLELPSERTPETSASAAADRARS